MSGVELGLAVAGCVFGFIQAYDAAGRTIERIKERRQARRAPAPSIYLEKSLEQGKRDIQALVVSGKERFGPEFEEGDEILRIAILHITVQTQAALLERLAEAREDDSVVDFSECIEAADTGRLKASIAINEYYLRKQKEAAKVAASTTPLAGAAQPMPIVAKTIAQPVQYGGPASDETSRTKAPTNPPQMQPAPAKRTNTFPTLFKRPSRTATEQSTLSTASTLYEARPTQPSQGARDNRFNSITKRQTARQIDTSRPHLDDHRRSDTSFGSSNTGYSSTTSPPSLRPTASRRTSHSSYDAQAKNNVANVSPITMYGGCCKYAHMARDGKMNKAFNREEASPYGTPEKDRRFRYICDSRHCKFHEPAYRDAKKHWVVDDKVRRWHSIEYRWQFLAKSHVPQLNLGDKPQYRCIICILLGGQSETFLGHGHLFMHVITHAGDNLGNTKLEGPITFSNQGAALNANFDINFPEVEETTVSDSPTSPSAMLAGIGIKGADNASKRTSVSRWSDDIDMEKNVWANGDD